MPGALTRPIAAGTLRVDAISRDRLAIGIAYALAWAAMLVNRGLYWDDWSLAGQSSASIVQAFRELGMPWLGILQAAILAMPSPGLVGHAVVFGTYLLSALILHAILCRTPGLSRLDALVAALTFAVLPVNYARIALIDLPYGLSLLAFLAATWLLIEYLDRGGLGRRIGALALYLLSFSTASLLILYAVPMALAAVIVWRSGKVSLRAFIPRHADFIAIPVVFWLLKSAFFAPTGAYEGYNALTLRGLSRVPRELLPIPAQTLGEPLVRAIAVGGLLGVAVGVVVAIWLFRRSRVVETGDFIAAPWLALIGVALLALGVVGYLAVDRIPTIWDWSSRHQLLVPLGAGLLAASAARGLRSRHLVARAVGLSVGLLIGISMVADARTLVAYQADWFKQVALMQAAKSDPAIQAARHIRVTDAATGLNTLRRTYRFYEYNAIFAEALGDTTRLVAPAGRDPAAKDVATFIPRPAYHMGQYVPSPIDLDLAISMPRGKPGGLEVLRLVVLEAFDPLAFESEVSDLIEVDTVPVASAAS